MCFFFNLVLFLGCFRAKTGFLVWFMVEPKISGQPSQVNLVRSKLGQTPPQTCFGSFITKKNEFLPNKV
jgi:hypothetical protein